MRSWWSLPALVLLLVFYCSTVLVRASSIFCDDSELCLSKRFLRFGRTLGEDPYYRISKNFYRLGRGYRPYQDKRFLRFGRSQQPGNNDIYDESPLVQLGEPYSRKKRSPDTDSQLQFTHDHVKRSTDQSQNEQLADDDASKMIKKRAIDDDISNGELVDKRFMRFGRGSTADNEVNKRFMRFGKRLIPVKRFMRFGRNNGVRSSILASLPGVSKRFMRFGKRLDVEGKDGHVVNLDNEEIHKLNDVLSFANQLKSESEQENSMYGMDKRFMRFGKRDTEAVGVSSDS